MARVFVSPLYHIVQRRCPASLIRPSDLFHSVGLLTLSCHNRAAMHSGGARLLLFFLFFVPLTARVADDAKPPDMSLRRCPGAYALRCGAWHQVISCRSCMPCSMSCTFTAQLAFSLCVVSLASSKSSSRNMVTACNNSRLSRCSARPQTPTKLLLAPQPCIASLRPNILSCFLDLFRRLSFSAQLIIILLIKWDFPQ